MEFKDVLKMLRIEKGLTQEQLAKAIESTQSTIHLWESGKSDVTGYYLIKLSKALNTTTDELLGLEFLPPRSDIANQTLGLINTMSEKRQETCFKLVSVIHECED